MTRATPYATPLRVVPNDTPESPASRAKRLKAEADAAGAEHVNALVASMNETERLMAETVGVECVKQGIRDLCRQESPKLAALLKNVASLGARV